MLNGWEQRSNPCPHLPYFVSSSDIFLYVEWKLYSSFLILTFLKLIDIPNSFLHLKIKFISILNSSKK